MRHLLLSRKLGAAKLKGLRPETLYPEGKSRSPSKVAEPCKGGGKIQRLTFKPQNFAVSVSY